MPNDSIGENDHAPHRQTGADDEEHSAINQIPQARRESKPPPPQTDHEKPCCKKRDWFDYAKAIVEVIGLGALLVYTGYTIKMYCTNKKAANAAESAANTAAGALTEVQKQTTLTKQQLVGTLAAVVVFSPNITGRNGDKLNATLDNRGHVTSPNAHVDFTIRTAPLSNLDKLSAPRHCSGTIAQLAPGGEGPICDIGLSPGSEFAEQKYTVKIEGSYDFDNGFGDRLSQTFCRFYIGRWQAKNTSGQIETGTGGFLPCADFREQLNYIRSHPPK